MYLNIDLLHELPFYDELSIEKISKAFKRYARNYKIEIIDSKDPLAQLDASKSIIKNLFKDLLREIKGFKYQVTVKVLLGKHKENGDTEFAPVYFNCTTKAVINFNKYMPDKYFQEILYRIGNWINEKSGWVIESIEAEYLNNTSHYQEVHTLNFFFLCGFSFTDIHKSQELPHKLRNSLKGLINFNNDGNKCFLWCHIRNLNALKKYIL